MGTRAPVCCGPLLTLWRLRIPSWSSSGIRVLQCAHVRVRTGWGCVLISYNLLSPWHRYMEVLNGQSLNSTVLQWQVKAHEEGVLASTSAPENSTIAWEANFIGECCLPPRTGPHQETKLLTQCNDLLKTQLQQQIFLAAESSVFAENLSPWIS